MLGTVTLRKAGSRRCVQQLRGIHVARGAPGKVRLDVLGILLVLRVLRSATNVGHFAGKQQIGLREGPQLP